MARIIPNENSYIAFLTTIASPTLNPTAVEVGAGVDLTPFVISINASTRGNVVQTPDFSTLFETSIPGTVTSTFEADMYRDDTTDTAWETLPRSTKGYFVISRFGGKGSPTATPASALHQPIAADKVEVWPVLIVARAAANLTNNTAQTFTVQAAVYQTPNESAVVS